MNPEEARDNNNSRIAQISIPQTTQSQIKKVWVACVPLLSSRTHGLVPPLSGLDCSYLRTIRRGTSSAEGVDFFAREMMTRLHLFPFSSMAQTISLLLLLSISDDRCITRGVPSTPTETERKNLFSGRRNERLNQHPSNPLLHSRIGVKWSWPGAGPIFSVDRIAKSCVTGNLLLWVWGAEWHFLLHLPWVYLYAALAKGFYNFRKHLSEPTWHIQHWSLNSDGPIHSLHFITKPHLEYEQAVQNNHVTY